MDEQALVSNKTYAHYFGVANKMAGILSCGVATITNGGNQDIIKTGLEEVISRLRYSSRLFEYKYAYSAASLTGLQMRIHESNFPHVAEISNMETTLYARDELIVNLDPVEKLKRDWLDEVYRSGTDDHQLLWKIGERSYLDALDKDKMLKMVMLGNFEYRGESDCGRFRNYAFWWASYNPVQHAPCLQVVEFTQDICDGVGPVHEKGEHLSKFLETILTIGAHHAPVGVVAHDIDRSQRYIHPVKLTRIQFDKLYAISDLVGLENMIEDDVAAYALLSEYANPDDFILVMSHDIVLAKETKVKEEGFLFGKIRPMQVFDLDSNDPRAFERNATTSDVYIVMPHSVAQMCQKREWREKFSPLKEKHIKLVYTDKGEVNGIA